MVDYIGQFNTVKDVWLKPQILRFIKNSGYRYGLDPFAGKGDLIKAMHYLGLQKVQGYDIDPSLKWRVNDGLKDIPFHEDTIPVTNPPYYAKVSMSKFKTEELNYFEGNRYTDLYQLAIEKVLDKYVKAVFIIPETYFLSGFFKDFVKSITILEENPFTNTDCPVCVTCFDKSIAAWLSVDKVFDIYKNDDFLFDTGELENRINKLLGPKTSRKLLNIKFNDKEGNIGLRGVDGVRPEDRIRFCLPSELDYDFDKIKISSRAVSILNVSSTNFSGINEKDLIEKSNYILEELRSKTHDIVFAPFKNNNKIGARRRRIDFGFAKRILNKARRELQ